MTDNKTLATRCTGWHHPSVTFARHVIANVTAPLASVLFSLTA